MTKKGQNSRFWSFWSILVILAILAIFGHFGHFGHFWSLLGRPQSSQKGRPVILTRSPRIKYPFFTVFWGSGRFWRVPKRAKTSKMAILAILAILDPWGSFGTLLKPPKMEYFWVQKGSQMGPRGSQMDPRGPFGQYGQNGHFWTPGIYTYAIIGVLFCR